VRIQVENIGVGTAFVSDPRGQIVAKLQSNVPSMLVCEIDLSQVRTKPISGIEGLNSTMISAGRGKGWTGTQGIQQTHKTRQA
jgi:hypothetical protein